MINVSTIRKHQTIHSVESLVFKLCGISSNVDPLCCKPLYIRSSGKAYYCWDEWQVLQNCVETRRRNASLTSKSRRVIACKLATHLKLLKYLSQWQINRRIVVTTKLTNSDIDDTATLPTCLRVVATIDTFPLDFLLLPPRSLASFGMNAIAARIVKNRFAEF